MKEGDHEVKQLLDFRHTNRQWRTRQKDFYGPDVPLLRCPHHFPILNVAFNGRLFESDPVWEPQIAAHTVVASNVPPGWFHYGKPPGNHAAFVDFLERREGAASARLESQPSANWRNEPTCDQRKAFLAQSWRVHPWRGKTLRVTAQLRSDSLDVSASLGINFYDRLNGNLSSLALPEGRRLRGTTPWHRVELSGLVPTNAEVLTLVADIDGSGRLWIDDIKMEIDGRPVEPRPVGPTNFYATLPMNLDLNAPPVVPSPPRPDAPRVTTPRGWCAPFSDTNALVTVETNLSFSGRASARLEARPGGRSPGCYLMQTLPPEGMDGTRLRLTARLKGGEIHGAASLFARVWYVGTNSAGENGFTRTNLTVTSTPLTGPTADWTLHEITLPMPGQIKGVEYGCWLVGTGTVWVDDFKVEWLNGEGVIRPLPAGAGGHGDFEE